MSARNKEGKHRAKPLHPSPKDEKRSQPDEYTIFSTALQKILTVSHEDMKKRLSNASSARVSNEKG
jgi:hypothetical protein